MTRQLVRSTTIAATLGAIAEPSDPHAAQAATAEVRRAGGKVGSTRASDDGTTIAPPSACTIRPATHTQPAGAAALTSVPATNVATPAKKTRRRPVRSASRPAITMNVASVML